MRGRFKAWAAPYLQEHPEFALAKIDPADPFFASKPLYLEIGIGKGDFIVGMAELQPGHYLGLEKDVSVLGMAGKKIEASGLTNVRIMGIDFDAVYEDLKAFEFDAIYLNFSDPWPKKKHAKRRLTFAPRLKKMADLLGKTGKIIIKTDNVGLYEFSLEQIELTDYRLVNKTEDYVFDETKDVQSEYERLFRSKGQPIYRIELAK